MAGAWDDARRGFEESLKLEPDSARAAHGRAMALDKLGREVEPLR